MSIVLYTLQYLAIVGALGWLICWGFGHLMDWALDVEEGNL